MMKITRRSFMKVLGAAAFAGSLAACGSAPAASTAASSAASHAAAASSTASYAEVTGKVMIYTSMYEDIIDVINKKVKEVFPKCDIEFFYGGTGTLQSKIAAEQTAGKLGCDMLMVAEPAYSLELKENNILYAYKTPEAENLSFAYDADGYWYPVRVCTMVLAYNPDLYKKEELATTFKDFATKPELKGYISMSNPLTSGTAMASIVALQGAYGDEYFQQLGAQNVTVESGSVALTKLETGECKEIMILEESVLKKRQEEGSTLEVIYPEDGVISIPSTIMTVNDDWSANKNTAACEAITDWFISEEGQKFIVDGWMHSVRKDFDGVPYDSVPNDEIYAKTLDIDWERCYKERDSIRKLFEEYVTIPAQ
jgi:iron(III) transport system substrate-binding protein